MCLPARWCGRKTRWNMSASCASSKASPRSATTASKPRDRSREQTSLRHYPHRRRMLGQSRARRLGRHPKFGDTEKELKGGEAHTTNNRMELMAAISALEALKKPCAVDLYTD